MNDVLAQVLKLTLGNVLGDPSTKKTIMDELSKLAASTDNELTEEAVVIFGKIYDVVVPMVISKAG